MNTNPHRSQVARCVSKDQRSRCYSVGRAVSGLAHAAGYLDRLLLMILFSFSVFCTRTMGGKTMNTDLHRTQVARCVSKDQRSRWYSVGRAVSGLAHAAGYLIFYC